MLLWFAIAASFAFSAGPRSSGRDSILENFPRGEETPKIIADLQPWFGDPDHIQVGYNSSDPSVIRNQIKHAKNMGIYAFAVDWYGPRRPFLDRSYAVTQKVASEHKFHVAIMYDETEQDDGHATEDALEAMDLAYKKYIGPGAEGRGAYLMYQGHPVIFVFPKHGNTDWDQVRQLVNRWDAPPILLYKDNPPPQYADDFDGQYPWVHPGNKGWTADGSDWGEEYLDNFYKKMNKSPDKIAVGGAWPGFDDSRAAWGLNRHIDRRCGKTLEDTLSVFTKYDDPAHPMPFLLIATWNDYEEGTDIENGVSHCSANSSSKP
jgi:hypothetical protein